MIDPDVVARIAERKIQEAIEEGKFDNLPGKGKPLILEEDSTTPSHLRMANKVLKNAGVLPDWMQVQQDITAERQEVVKQRERLIRENQTRRARVSSLPIDHPHVHQYAEWHAKGRAAHLKRLKGVNTSILKLCIMAPSSTPPVIPYRIEPEMTAFDAEFVGLDRQPEVRIEPAPEEGALRSIARENYKSGSGGALRGLFQGLSLRRNGNLSTPAMGAESEDIRRADVPDEMKRQG